MTMNDLKPYGIIYLATPYTRYRTGIEMAFIDAARLTAKLIKSGLKIYSPIVHTHPIAIHGNIDAKDHSIWLPFDFAMMRKADVLLVAQMDGWDESFGIAEEIQVFNCDHKPIFYLDPDTMEIHERASRS